MLSPPLSSANVSRKQYSTPFCPSPSNLPSHPPLQIKSSSPKNVLGLNQMLRQLESENTSAKSVSAFSEKDFAHFSLCNGKLGREPRGDAVLLLANEYAAFVAEEEDMQNVNSKTSTVSRSFLSKLY